MESLAYLDNKVIHWLEQCEKDFTFQDRCLFNVYDDDVILKIIFTSCFSDDSFQERKETLDFLESLVAWDPLVRKALLERWDYLVRQQQLECATAAIEKPFFVCFK